MIRAAAAELPQISLDDALRICWAVRHNPAVFERACLRWLARFCLEAEAVELLDVAGAGRALHALAVGGAERPAREELERLCESYQWGPLDG